MNCCICGAPAVFKNSRMVCPNGHGNVANPTASAEKLTLMPPAADSLFSEPAFRDESLISTRCDSCGKPVEIPAFDYYNQLTVCRMIICDGCQVERLKKALPLYFCD
jgi:hypothetical protein